MSSNKGKDVVSYSRGGQTKSKGETDARNGKCEVHSSKPSAESPRWKGPLYLKEAAK